MVQYEYTKIRLSDGGYGNPDSIASLGREGWRLVLISSAEGNGAEAYMERALPSVTKSKIPLWGVYLFASAICMSMLVSGTHLMEYTDLRGALGLFIHVLGIWGALIIFCSGVNRLFFKGG